MKLSEKFKPEDIELVSHGIEGLTVADMTHGVIAVQQDGKILHFVTFPSEPTDNDIQALYKELYEEEELGLAGRIDFELARCPPSVFEEIMETVKKKAAN